MVAGIGSALYDTDAYGVLGIFIFLLAFVVTIAGCILFKVHDKYRLKQLKEHITLPEFSCLALETELTGYPDLRKFLEETDFHVTDYVDNGLFGSRVFIRRSPYQSYWLSL